MRKTKRKSTLVRVSVEAQDYFAKVKRNTGMSVVDQVDEMIVVMKYVLENQAETIGIGVVKSSLNRCMKPQKKKKTPFGHTHEPNDKGYCDTCGKVLAEVEN